MVAAVPKSGTPEQSSAPPLTAPADDDRASDDRASDDGAAPVRRVSARRVLAAAAAVLGFVWPGWFNSKVFDTVSVQNGVKRILQDDYKISVNTVTCPSSMDVKVGNSYNCQVTVGGQTKTVQITIKTADGQYEVAQPR